VIGVCEILRSCRRVRKMTILAVRRFVQKRTMPDDRYSSGPTRRALRLDVVVSFLASKQYGVSISVASVILIIVMPSMTVTFYVITALFYLLMTRLKIAVDRYIIVAFAIITYLYFAVDTVGGTTQNLLTRRRRQI
jgi:hypothetical protein